MFQVGVLKNGVQGDRLIALQHVAEEAVLEAGIRLDQQDSNLLLANLNDPRQAIVFFLKFVRLRLHFNDILELADLGRTVERRTGRGWPSGPAVA